MKRRSGHSLVEVMVVAAIFIILAVAVYMVLESTARASAATSIGADVDGRARETLDRIARDLEGSSVSTLVPTSLSASPSLTFRRAEGYTGGVVTYGMPITYAFSYAPGEVDNGTDDNNDRCADEGAVTRAEGAMVVTLCRDVREGGLAFTRSGNSIEIALTLERLDERGRAVTRTYRTRITLRN